MPGGKVRERAFPFYVVCDVSQSMWDPKFHVGAAHVPFDVLRETIPHLLYQIETNPSAADAAMISIVTFADAPCVYLPLCRPRDVSVVEELKPGAQTNYAAVLDKLAASIRDDCARLRDEFDLKPATVFFLTDGQPYVGSAPQDEGLWTRARDQLVSPAFPFRPEIVAFGLGSVEEWTLCRLATAQAGQRLAFTADGAAHVAGVAGVLRAIMHTLFRSIGDSVDRGALTVVTPPGTRRAGCLDAGPGRW